MDSIYSRKRIKIPKVKGFYTNNKNAKKIFSIFVIVLIATFTFYNAFKGLNPIFENLCVGKAKDLATCIINEVSNEVLDKIDYNDIIKIEKDKNNNVLKTDVTLINKISSDIVLETEKRLLQLENETIKIPLGALTGNRYLAGSGPNINIKVISTGGINTEIRNEFESKGINQTVYRIYLELICKVNVVTQYKIIESEVVNQVLLVETVIVGDVPESYYNIEGLDNDEAINLIK